MKSNRNWGCLIFVGLIILFLGYWFFDLGASSERKVEDTEMELFKGVVGPLKPSYVAKAKITDWRRFNSNRTAGKVAIYLTDTNSCWLGIVQGLKNAGIPFIVTRSLNQAFEAPVVFVYPFISGKVMKVNQFQQLRDYVEDGGTLIANQILGGGIQSLFGFEKNQPRSNHSEWVVNQYGSDLLNLPWISAGSSYRFANPKLFSNNFKTFSLKGVKQSVLDYEDGSSFMCVNEFGKGKAYAIGMDLGNVTMRYANARGFEGYHQYANGFEPGIDVLYMLLRSIYEKATPNAVTLKTVPAGKSLNVLITHDIDFTRSIRLVDDYAKAEADLGVLGTYFIQTKYIKDWNDDIFFTKKNSKHLNDIRKRGMEIGSHSVAHSYVFSKFDMGTGTEKYPDYRPFVVEKFKAKNGTILGELRISKFLLETFVKNTNCQSFRPGHLQYPFKLPQALRATGFINSSSVTANSVLSHYPYFLIYDRAYNAMTDVLEIPVTIEDELNLPLLERLKNDLIVAEQISQYGGVYNALIHTDICGDKLLYQQKLMVALKDLGGSFTTVTQFADWWRKRFDIEWSIEEKGGDKLLKIDYSRQYLMRGCSFKVPSNWRLVANSPNFHLKDGILTIEKLSRSCVVRFK